MNELTEILREIPGLDALEVLSKCPKAKPERYDAPEESEESQ